eukprot:329864_1
MSKQEASILVDGFIANIRTMLKRKIIIPNDIYLLCFEFYYLIEEGIIIKRIYFLFCDIFIINTQNKEYFAFIGDGTKTSNDNKTITKQKGSFGLCSSFGNISIKSDRKNICQWNMKINHIGAYAFCIGISSEYSINSNITFCENKGSNNYSYNRSGQKVSKYRYSKYGELWSNGDVIGIKLDLKERQVEFYRNRKSQGIAFKNIDVGTNIMYKLAILLQNNGQSATIDSFEYI